MLKRMFALSNQGLRDLNKGIAATTLSNLCLIAPVSLLVMVIWELLNVISGQESSMRDHAALIQVYFYVALVGFGDEAVEVGLCT